MIRYIVDPPTGTTSDAELGDWSILDIETREVLFVGGANACRDWLDFEENMQRSMAEQAGPNEVASNQ